MNLSLIFFVLSAFVAYLLYDMFKKSRQEQQMIQAQNSQSQQSTNKLRPSYESQCQILKSLHEEKINSVKRKTISIHILEDIPEKAQISSQGKQKIKETLQLIRQTYNLHLIINSTVTISNPLLKYLRLLNLSEIEFKTNEGAVAILRQLNPNAHLEGDMTLYKSIVQYLASVWVADSGRSGERLVNQYKSEWEMLVALNQLITMGKKKEE